MWPRRGTDVKKVKIIARILFPWVIIWGIMFSLNGCVELGLSQNTIPAKPLAPPEGENVSGVTLKEFYLSAGDEINITIYKHEELNKKIKIPRDGRFFFPIVGEVEAEGKNIREVRSYIIKKLAEYREYFLLPGDEISIDVYSQKELERKVTIPPDGQIFYPLVGEIDTTGKTIREVREIIITGLSEYKNYNIVPGDEISIRVFRNDDLSREIIIPPDGCIFYPLVGEIDTNGKSIKEVRRIITDALTRYLQDVQVEVNYITSSRPKLLLDPQVSVNIVKIDGHKMINDPQVGIEVTAYEGHKVFVLGEVKTPGVYLSDGTTNIIEAISMAGSFTPDAKKSNVLLIRPGADKSKFDVVLVDLEQFLTKGGTGPNLILQKGDAIYVPRTFISNVDRFFAHLSAIVSPLLSLETGYFIGQQIESGGGATSAVGAN